MVGRMPLSAATSDHAFASSILQPDEDVTKPMCGHGVITKLLKKSPNVTSSPGYNSSSADASLNRTCLVPAKGMPFSRRRYEEVNRHLLASPEDTESSSSSSDKSNEERKRQAASDAEAADPYIVQFVHGFEHTDSSLGSPSASSSASSSPQRQSHVQSFGLPRAGLWSTPLPAVTEETSSVETEETPRERDLSANPSTNSASANTASTGKYTGPEKSEMLAAMRNLVLKQQAALKELSKENTHYRKRLEEYQNKLIGMKRDQVEKDGMIAQLQLEKEAFETEAMWLRGQIESMSREVDIDDDEVQDKLRSLMLGGAGGDLLSPSVNAERAATDAFKSFKRTLSPGTVMDRAVRSLKGSKNPTWGWDTKDVETDNDQDNHSAASESVPDDERIMSVNIKKTRSQDSKQDRQTETKPKPDSRDEDPDISAREASNTPTRASPVMTPATPKSAASTPTASWSSPSKMASFIQTKSPSFTPTKSQREEVDVFKQRLESVQKRRSERQAERSQQASRPTVRFGTISI